MRDRLIELIEEASQIWDESQLGISFNEICADHLLANGVIVPPCKVGDTVWQTDGVRLYESTVGEMTFTTRHTLWFTEGVAFDERAIGRTVFLAREEAEQALRKEDERR